MRKGKPFYEPKSGSLEIREVKLVKGAGGEPV
jgi:hypothetical protein